MEFDKFVSEWLPTHSVIDLRSLYGVCLYVNNNGVIVDMAWIDESKISRTQSVYRYVMHDKLRDPIPQVIGVHSLDSPKIHVIVRKPDDGFFHTE